MKRMSFFEKRNRAEKFFEELIDKLNDSYEVIQSCNKDVSKYLCLNGTTGEVTYSSKPEYSFRISDHWNWYSNTSKCPNPYYIQCYSEDFPYPGKRVEPFEKATRPKLAMSVCLFKNGSYHVVFGERFDRRTKKWSWIEKSVDEVLADVFA